MKEQLHHIANTKAPCSHAATRFSFGSMEDTSMSRRKRKENCNKFRKQQASKGAHNFTVIEGGVEQRTRRKHVEIAPRNFNQDDLLGYLQDDSVNIVFAIGPAGTGKTLISTLAGIDAMKKGEINKFVITRPAVSVDEQHGFLPGTLQEKMAPWTRPIFDVFEEYYTPDQLEFMINDGKIEIAPLAYMRGRTFKNSFIIADEMQNATDSQMKMMLTRIGEGSKLVVTGDLAQHDRGYEENGLKLFMEKLARYQSDRIKMVQFGHSDVERHEVVTEVLNIYNDQ
jgi:phosphate starvation-inducible PhoH-like protein